MKKERKRSINFNAEIESVIGFAIGRKARSYQQKKKTEYTMIILCFIFTMKVTKYKMVRIINQKHNLCTYI